MIPAHTILTKGHGAGNDFLLLADPEGAMEVAAEDIARLCDRHWGIGADGLIRVVRSRVAQAEGNGTSCDNGAGNGARGGAGYGGCGTSNGAHDGADGSPDGAPDGAAEWFMDYRNADGSIAEMCGNGVRVFVHYLAAYGYVELSVGESIAVATRGGIKTVTREGKTCYTVDMGEYRLPYGADGADTQVDIPGLGLHEALSVTMPNPHTVVVLNNFDELARADLSRVVTYDPAPPNGTNLELVVPGSPAQMRVLERGVGETLACGTGTCAVAIGLLLARGEAEGTVPIHSPGGDLSVRIEAGRAYLTGPAELTADLRLLS